jgi:hypothetical protein
MRLRPGPRDPCYCGSGKKYRSCHGKGRLDAYPRSSILFVNPGDRPIEDLSLQDNHETGEVTLLFKGTPAEPAQAFSDYGYTKPDGTRKTTLRVPFVDEKMTRHPDRYLEQQFTGLIAIDTNTETIGQETVSITSAFVAEIEKPSADRGGNLVVMRDLVIEFRDPSESPERIGWWEVLRTMGRPKPAGFHFGIVADCHMNDHPLINARVQPIRANFFLPPEFWMFYASTDKSGDSAVNKLLRFADKRATEIREWNRKNPRDLGWQPLPPNAPYRAMRKWTDRALDDLFRGGKSLPWRALEKEVAPGAFPSQLAYPNVTVRLKP